MNRRLRWRVVATLVVTFGISIFAWYPLLAERVGLPNPGFMQEKRLRLGLDLEGGVHLVMRVNTDDAVLLETRNTAARLDEGLGRHGVARQLRRRARARPVSGDRDCGRWGSGLSTSVR